jgi:hypothetical protein
MDTAVQPYVGPRPFEQTQADRNRFFGRNDEASELMSCVIAHSAVLLYSQSGAGKTSLINARLAPMLEKAGFEVLKPARVRAVVPPDDLVVQKLKNIYAFNVLRTWDQGATTNDQLAGMCISDFLKSHKMVVPEGEDGNPRVAIFDQFEELFTSYQERPRDREDFLDQVGAALDEDRLLRVVFAMREDYIAELDPYLPLLPEKLRTRFRIERLSEDDALLAITEPLRGSDYSYAEGVAEQLVENLLVVPVETAKGVQKVRGESVEPVQLQVVCQTLWENCQNSWKKSEKKVITRQFLDQFGDVDQALSGFYEKAIKVVVETTSVKEGPLRRWFEKYLITSAGTRGTVFRGPTETGDLANQAVDKLVNQHIIRAELRTGSRWYELAHDRFIAPIKNSNERWFRDHSGGDWDPRRLETLAQNWARDSRQKEDLISDEGELLVAERWLESTAAADVGYTDTLLAFVQASRAAKSEEKAKSARRLKLLAATLLVLVILLGVALFAAFISQRAAIRSKQAATESQKRAETQAAEAIIAQTAAIEQKIIADDLTAKYKNERERADQLTTVAQAREKTAKQDKAKAVQYADAGKGLLKKGRDAEASYQFAQRESRDLCDKKTQLQNNLRDWEEIQSGYETLGDKAQAAAIQKRIDAIRSEYNNVICAAPQN